jgi:FkbM family methyltransferase
MVYSKVQTEHFLVHSADNGIGKIVFATGEYDFQKFILTIDLCNKNLDGRKKPTVLIDAGANIGTICIPAVARGFVQRAVAIEPEPLNCRLLRANIALNGLSNSIVVHECALGASTDIELALELNASNLGDHGIPVNTKDDIERKNKVHLRSETLDGLCPPVDYPDSLLRIDIQGYEGFAY